MDTKPAGSPVALSLMNTAMPGTLLMDRPADSHVLSALLDAPLQGRPARTSGLSSTLPHPPDRYAIVPSKSRESSSVAQWQGDKRARRASAASRGSHLGAGVLPVVAQQVLHEARGAGLAVAQLQQGAPVPDGGQAQHHRGNRQREPASLWNLHATLSLRGCLQTLCRLPVSGTLLAQPLYLESVMCIVGGHWTLHSKGSLSSCDDCKEEA